jgi:hypothetical protein
MLEAAVNDLPRRSAEESAVAARLATGSGPLGGRSIEAARRHRVHLLLAAALDTEERTRPWAEGLLRELRTAAVRYDRRERALRGVLDACASRGIEALVLKGAALAYTLYSEPFLRPRTDIDLLIRRESLDSVDAALAADGWIRDAEPDAELASAQRHYAKPIGGSGDIERLDLHWRIVNPPVFVDVVSFDDLLSRAVPLPLSPAARTLSHGDALFEACLHLAAHHAGEAQLLWLYDIHLLMERLDAAGAAQFTALASPEPALTACRGALHAAVGWFGSPVAAALLDRLPQPRRAGGTSDRPVTKLRADLSALPTWGQRVTLLREHLFPSMSYLRARYPSWPAALLPVAAVHRIVAGAPKWLRRERSERSERVHRIDGEGAPRGDVAGQRDHAGERERHQDQRRRVEARHVDE